MRLEYNKPNCAVNYTITLDACMKTINSSILDEYFYMDSGKPYRNKTNVCQEYRVKFGAINWFQTFIYCSVG